MTKLCGIYLIAHIESGLKYVGQSVNMKSRWNQHSRGAKNTKLGCSILKHGWASFTCEILELCDKTQLNQAEQRWITHHNCVSPNGFNLTTGGSVQSEYSEETRTKISLANSRRVVSDETRAKLASRVITAETRAKISASHTGKQLPEQHRKALLEAAIRCAETNIPRLAELNRGKKHLPESVEKRRLKHLGMKRTEQAKQNMSAANKGKLIGRVQTEQHKANVSAALMGHKHSPETIEKLRQKARNRTPEHTAKITASKAANRLLRQRIAAASA